MLIMKSPNIYQLKKTLHLFDDEKLLTLFYVVLKADLIITKDKKSVLELLLRLKNKWYETTQNYIRRQEENN